jgi:hypothetical protein
MPDKNETVKKSYEFEKIDLKKGLNEISFRNSQIADIRNLQMENAKLKDAAGKSSSKKSGLSNIKGLAGLKGFTK